MPNVTINILKMKNIGKKDWFVSGVETFRDGSERPYCTLDFRKIVPEPETEEECPDRYNRNIIPDDSIQTDSDKPWFNWYNWRVDTWGTKWNGFECKIINDDAIKFETAWSPAEGVMQELSRTYYKDRVLLLFYNDEFDCNWYVNEYRNGDVTSFSLSDVFDISRRPDNDGDDYSDILKALEEAYLSHQMEKYNPNEEE